MVGLLEGIRSYQRLADKHGVEDIFQDNASMSMSWQSLSTLHGTAARSCSCSSTPGVPSCREERATTRWMVTGASTSSSP